MATDGYKCVFSDDLCPVRREFKLKPENLLGFCQTCPTQEPKQIAVENYIPGIVAKFIDHFFKERELLQTERLELVKMLVDKDASTVKSTLQSASVD